MTDPEIVEGTRRRPEFAGNRKRLPFDAPAPKLKFGEHGELTHETIKQANLTQEEQKRAYEMMKVQKAYLEILDCLSYPTDPEGHVHDLNAIGPTRLAIAWTLALCGFRRSGKKYIKKQFSSGAYANAHTWVDVRRPDAPEEPEHRSGVLALPPDTCRLDADPLQSPEIWHVAPKITYDDPNDAPNRGKAL